MEPGPARSFEGDLADQSAEGRLDVGIEQPGAAVETKRQNEPTRLVASTQILTEQRLMALGLNGNLRRCRIFRPAPASAGSTSAPLPSPWCSEPLSVG